MNYIANRREQKFPVSIKRGSVEVKVYRTAKNGHESFVVNYYQDGKRHRRTFSDFDRAKTDAETTAGRLASSDSAILTLSGADLSAYQRARQVLDPIGVAIEIAATDYADAKKKLGEVSLSQAVEFFLKRHPKNIEPRSVQSIVDEFILAKESEGLSERYIESLRWALPKFTTAFHCNIGDVTAPDITKWLRQLKVAPRTQNNLRNSLQTLFSFAKAQRYVAKDHDEIADVPIVKDKGGEIEVFTPLELEEIFAHAGDKLISFLALGAFAGIRHAEIQRLDWQDIRFDDSIIEIHASKAKTASRRIVPILDNLRKWLLSLKQDLGPVCPYLNAAFELHLITKKINEARRAAWALEKGISAEQLKRTARLVRADVKAGKKPGRQKGDVPPAAENAKVEGWTPFAWKHNALRHSFISYRIAQVQNVHQVALEAGNSPQIIFSNYRELVRPADAQKWFSIVPRQTENIIQLLPMNLANAGTVPINGVLESSGASMRK